MSRIIALILLLIPAIYGASWMVENPGIVRFEWFGYRIEAPAALLAFMLICVILALWALSSLISTVAMAPFRTKRHYKYVRQQRGIEAMNHAMIALATHDVKAAKSALAKADKYLPENPATLLMHAQLSHKNQDNSQTKQYLEALSHHESAAFLGQCGLARSLVREKKYAEALHHAREAFSQKPNNSWVAQSFLEIALRNHAWIEATEGVRIAVRARAISKDEGRHLEAMMHTYRSAEAIKSTHFMAAEEYLQQALKSEKHFLPAAIAYARLLSDQNERRKFVKLIHAQWRYKPHPTLTELYLDMLQDASPKKKEKAIEKLTSYSSEHGESDIATAMVAIENAQWEKARNALKIALTKEKTARIYQMLAAVEKGEHGDNKAAEKWLTKAAGAMSDKQWLCSQCGTSHEQWQMVCDHCDSFDSIVWGHAEHSQQQNPATESTLLTA